MSKRDPGYYWITWTDRAEPEFARRKPGPLIAQWDGSVWWFVRSDAYRFDCEVEVLGDLLPPTHRRFLRPLSTNLRLAKA
ncbi:MAG TPA: hypothetical protein VMJ52_17345 [Xanthobacteraceae bacterium]|nr:hypothetical protein [Xanthobacteraceae bacterium]